MSNNPNGTDGPKVKIKASCFDCRHCKSTGYAVQGDSGHAVSCSLVDKRIGDTTWDTPTWCPLLAAAVDAANGTCDARAEIARLTAELAAARAEVDCGQDGPCAKAPGCARHWQERNRELVAELAAARAVTAGVCRYLDCAASDLLAVVTSLYETRARAISDATAARGTVGGLLAAGEERESRAWSEKGKAPPGSCPFCASRISMVQRDGYFIARCSHRGCGAVGPRMRSVSRAADLFCQPPRREAQGMSCGPIVASPPRPRCSCTHEAGDSRCNVHPTCSECGASTTRPVDGCEACRGPLPKGG